MNIDDEQISLKELLDGARPLGPEDGFVFQAQSGCKARVFTNGVALIAKGHSADDLPVLMVFNAARRAGVPPQVMLQVDQDLLTQVDNLIADLKMAGEDELSRLRERVSLLQRERSALEAELRSARSHMTDLHEVVAGGEQQVAELRTALLSRDAQLADLRAALETSRKELDGALQSVLMADPEKSLGRIAALEGELEAAQEAQRSAELRTAKVEAALLNFALKFGASEDMALSEK